MVKTLLKHEAKAYLHTLVPMNIILLCVALFTRIIWLFESDSDAFDTIGGSSVAALVIAMIVVMVMSVAYSIARFYKNLFTAEGYLTMTLPATPARHIFSKLICAVGFNILSFVVVFVAIAIATAGDMFIELCDAGFYLLGRYLGEYSVNGVMWIIEFIVLVIVYISTQFLLYYACITVGQLAKKNRVLAAFGAFFAHFFICQLLGTIFLVILEPILNIGLLRDLLELIGRHPKTSVHVILLVVIIGQALIGAIYYLIAHRIVSRRLNLE